MVSIDGRIQSGHGVKRADRYLPEPWSNRGFKPSVFVDTMVSMLGDGERSLEEVKGLSYEEGLIKRIDIETVREWAIKGEVRPERAKKVNTKGRIILQRYCMAKLRVINVVID